jgi:cytochrome P450
MVRIDVPIREDIVFLFNPELCEKVYRAAGGQPLRPGFDALRHTRNQDELTNQGAKGLLTSNGEEWHEFRSKVQQPMLRPKSTLRYTPDLEAIAEDFIQKKIMDKRDTSTMQVGSDFLDDLYKWSLESVSCLALNARLGCLEPNLPADSDQMRIIRGVSDILSNSMYLDNSLQTWRLFPGPRLRKFQRGYNTFKELSSVYITQAIKDIKAKKGEETGDPSLLEMFFDRGCDEATAIVMALDMMFAGIDTSSHLSAYAMYRLARNPEVQERLYQEIKTELPSPDSKLDKKALERMPFLKATVKETLRVNPPVAIMARMLTEPIELNGYQCPGNVVYATGHYFMSNSELYIEKPTEFIPHRWLRTQQSNATKLHPFLMMPFGHGARMCVGKRFAEQEVSIFLAKILQKFSVEWHHEDMVMKTETITKPMNPLKFTFKDR